MKRIVLIATAALFVLCRQATSQPPLPGPMAKSDSLRMEGDLRGAITEYRKVYIANPKDRRNIYNYACALSLNSEADSCFKYLNLAMYIDATIAPLLDPDFITVREDKRWKDFENNLVAKLNAKSKATIKDIEYARLLWRLMVLDQAYIYETGVAIRKLGFTSPVVSALQKFKSTLNKMNQEELEDLIARKGWPKNSEVGTDAVEAAFYVMQHSDGEKQQKYIPLLKKRCEENEASWINYAMLYDRMKMNLNLPQKYGTQMILDNRGSGSYDLYPLEDKAKVNEWRKEVGLPPLKSTEASGR